MMSSMMFHYVPFCLHVRGFAHLLDQRLVMSRLLSNATADFMLMDIIGLQTTRCEELDYKIFSRMKQELENY
jgi:hypothetical protein